MAFSLGRNDNNGAASETEEAEQRLRNRLADLEGRLEDQSKINRLRDHVQHMRQKHELELERTRIEAEQKVERVKDAAKRKIREARKQAKAERSRYERLVEDLSELEEQLQQVEARRTSLSEAGLTPELAPRGTEIDPAEEPRTFIRQLAARHREVADRLERLQGALGDGELSTPTTDVSVLEDRSQELLTNPEVRSKAMTVAEKARMFAEDPGKSQYYRELVLPYARAIEHVLEHEQRANTVEGARQALSVLQESFMDSRTYLLRRSGKLDDHEIEPEVVLERLDESPDDAVDRVNAALDTARALGPVDFFQNLAGELSRRIERGEDGAGVAAWILSDVTVALLEDETVRGWLESQR